MSHDKQSEISFTFGIPQRDQTQRHLPQELSVVEYSPSGAARKRSGGGYDPYANSPYTNRGSPADTARVRKPRVDLRKLSEWIQTTRRVDALREAQSPADAPLTARK